MAARAARSVGLSMRRGAVALVVLSVCACDDASTTSSSGSTGASSTTGSGGATTTSGPTSTSSGATTTSASSGSGGNAPGRQVVFANACAETIWVGALNAPNHPLPENGGFQLEPGASRTVELPADWSGRFWGRAGCTFDGAGNGSCASGDCGGKLECGGNGGKPPATLVEMTFAGFGGKDFYDVSLVDGFNLPMGITPRAGTFTVTDPNDAYDCGGPSCSGDANPNCPAELQVVFGNKVVGCRSAHEACVLNPQAPGLACAQNDDLYACIPGGPNAVSGSCYSPGANAACCGCPSWSPQGACNATNPKWALPSNPEKYAKVFKDACPTGYSFPYDDVTSTFTCVGEDYDVTFCP